MESFENLSNITNLTSISRDQLRSNYTLNKHYLEIDLEHLFQFDEEIANALQNFPAQLLPHVSFLTCSI
jgi:hypothetical protein